MPPEVKIIEQHHGAVTVVHPDGPLAGSDAEQFQQRFQDVLRENLGRVVLDVAAVPVLDSKGLETLVDLTIEMGQSGQVLKLCGANPTVRQVLEITGVSEQFEHFDDVNSAVRSFL